MSRDLPAYCLLLGLRFDRTRSRQFFFFFFTG